MEAERQEGWAASKVWNDESSRQRATTAEFERDAAEKGKTCGKLPLPDAPDAPEAS